jgi:hypothetical protein
LHFVHDGEAFGFEGASGYRAHGSSSMVILLSS